MKYRIISMLRESIRDNEGETIKKVLHQLGFTNVESVRMGKAITFYGDGRKINPEKIAEAISNPVMEDYAIEKEKEK